MQRKRWTHSQKLAILSELDAPIEEGGAVKAVARRYGLTPVQVRKWRANKNLMMEQRRSKKALSKGRKSSIQHLEEPLLAWAMTQRAADIPLTYRHLQAKACRLDENFRNLSQLSQYGQIRRLCQINAFVLRRGTTQAAQHPQETLDNALEWLAIMRPLASAPTQEKKFVLNMDQTPIYFSMPPGRTLELQGSNRVGVRTTSNSTERATCSLCVSADGDKLKPMLIFKGQPNGRIAKRELPEFETRNDIFLACQENAWQNDRNMIEWIDNCLVPWCQQRAAGAPVLLLLDSFSAHHSASTTQKLNELGIQKYKLPGGCTGLIQPVDCGIGKPFKDRIRDKWWDHIIEEQESDSPVLTNVSRELIARWAWESWQELP